MCPARCWITEAGFPLSMLHYLVQQFQRAVPIHTTACNNSHFGLLVLMQHGATFPTRLRKMSTTADSMTAERRSYTPKDIAEITGRHPESIRRKLRSEDLEGHKMGAEWIVFPDALREWLGDEVYENLFLPHEDEA